MKRISYLWPFGIAVVFCLGIAVGTYMPKGNLGVVRSQSREKINKLLDLLESQYLDGINADSLMQDVVYGIVNQLDPHSVYYSEDEKQQFEQSYSGSFSGIGVEYIMVEDTAVVIRTQPNSPADRAGMRHGDRIIGVDDWKWKPKESETLSQKLKGKEDSSVQLSFLDRDGKLTNTALKRKELPVFSVPYAQNLPNSSVFYIKISEFNANTYAEFQSKIKGLTNSQSQVVVLDLRDNGGGLVDQAVRVASEFLVNQEKILRIENRDKRFEDIYARKGGSLGSVKLYVLIDENSASSSEILAGALQDNDRALIVGRRSFGKGLIQNDFQFEDGSSIRLTTNRYYTPSGRSIQKPYSKDYDIYNKDLTERFAHGELYQRDSIHINDSLQFKTVHGRTVYGGGGIVPDLFVGLEGDIKDDGIVYLGKSTYMSHFVYHLIRKNPEMYNWSSIPQIVKYVNDKADLLTEFQNFLTRNFFELNLSNAEFLRYYIAAEMARQLISEQASQNVLLHYDPMVKAVLGDLQK